MTSPLSRKAALVMYFELRGVASWLLVLFLLALLAREAREKAVIGRTGKRAPFGTSSIRRAHGGRRRPAEVIESLCSSWEPIDARSGRVQEDRSLCIWWRSSPNWGSQPENLLLHDGPMRPDLVDPPGLAGDMASGRPEAVLQQEIPVI